MYMSTKIYSGFLLYNNANIFTFAEQARELLQPIVLRNIHQDFLDRMVRYYDSITYRYNNEYITPVIREEAFGESQESLTFRDLKFQVRQEFEKYDKPEDSQVEIVFLETKDGKKLGYLINNHYYTDKDTQEQTSYYEQLQKIDGFHKTYNYWNNTDREDGVSAKEWKQRETDWNVVRYGESLSVKGLVNQVVETYQLQATMKYFQTHDDLTIMSFEKRVNALAINQLVKEKNAELTNGEKLQINDIMSLMTDNELLEPIRKNITQNLQLFTWEEFRNITIPR